MSARKPHRTIVLIACLLAAACLVSARSGETDFILIINPGSYASEKLMKDWRSQLTRRELYEWGDSRGFTLIDDREPVVDNTAAYVSSRGSKVSISGLGRGIRYRVWIDFVRFMYGTAEPASVLKVFAAAPGVEKRLIETLAFRDIGAGYYHCDIPPDITARGAADLIFEEYARVPGNWGIWDIMVTSGLELPARTSIPGEEGINLEIIDRIVQ